MISVAIAAYNGEKYIEKQLKSILIQTKSVDEVVICDDRSTDNTVAICEDFIKRNSLKNWSVSVNEKNVGFCLNFYGAIAKCGGDVVFLADQDDEWLPEKVAVMSKTLDENPQISVLSSRYDVIDENSDVIENSGVTYLGDRLDDSIEYITAESLVGCSYIRGFSIALRREVAEMIRPIDLKSLMAHDWLICMLGCVKSSCAVLNTSLTHYRYHKDNVSLSAMNKENRSRQLSKRILGLTESVEGHAYIEGLTDDIALKSSISKFIAFENRRIKFLKGKNAFIWLSLGLKLRQYNRYYKGNGFRVWLGDLAYVFKK